MKMKYIAVTALLTFGMVGLASAVVIDFESDTAGSVPNGFISVDSPLVSFSDSLGVDLFLGTFGAQGDGQSLIIGGDDASYLIMDFSSIVNGLSLDFGNDDPGFSNPADLAVLTVFLGAAQVGQTSVAMNRDDIMNQTISFSGVNFDKATFFYDVSTSGLAEIVDNINVVPEPASIGLLGLISGGIYFSRRFFRA